MSVWNCDVAISNLLTSWFSLLSLYSVWRLMRTSTEKDKANGVLRMVWWSLKYENGFWSSNLIGNFHLWFTEDRFPTKVLYHRYTNVFLKIWRIITRLPSQPKLCDNIFCTLSAWNVFPLNYTLMITLAWIL
jgi:hypothetical protein